MGPGRSPAHFGTTSGRVSFLTSCSDKLGPDRRVKLTDEEKILQYTRLQSMQILTLYNGLPVPPLRSHCHHGSENPVVYRTAAVGVIQIVLTTQIYAKHNKFSYG